jgi:hypothetical protein
MKKCYACGKKLPVESFYKNKSKQDGLATECKFCSSKKDREYQIRNADQIKERRHEYYLKNKDVITKKVYDYIDANRDKHNAWGTKSKNKLKTEIFSHYCNGDIKCRMCEETELGVLTVDHINGNGTKHRIEIGLGRRGGGYGMYQWLKKNNYPDGFQILCFNCQFRKRMTEMKPKNPAHIQQVRAKYVRSIKIECLDHYGGRECKCGEKDMDVLTLDHVNDDGARHVRQTGKRGFGLYMMLRKNGFPKDPPLQVLCMNCNIRKRNKKYEEGKDQQTTDCVDAAISA